MALPPPAKYVTLSEAEQQPIGQIYDVIGVCTDYLPPAKSRGTDYTMTFSLSDPGWYNGRGMRFRFFEPTADKLPMIQNTGDVLLLKNVTTRMVGANAVAISNRITTWCVLSASSVVHSTCQNGSDIKFVSSPRCPRLTIPELQYARAIARQSNPDSYRPQTQATSLQVESIMIANGGTPPPRKDKYRALQDLILDKNNSARFKDGRPAFADLFGEVRRIYTGDYSRVDLYLTDYTTNAKLYNYQHNDYARDGDRFGHIQGNSKAWQGPWGRMTIEVKLWDAHAVFVRSNVKEGAVILIRNCHIKFDANGARLEAACRGDRDDPSRVNVILSQPFEARDDPRYQELLRHKTKYETDAIRKGLMVAPAEKARIAKRQRDDQAVEEDHATTLPKKMSKSKSKKLKQAREKQMAEAKASLHQNLSGDHPHATNPYVRCKATSIAVTPIEQIMAKDLLKRTTPNENQFHLPFQNAAYKCRVRVVDYYPSNIADFAVPCSNRSGGLSDAESLNGDELLEHEHSDPDSVRWEWRFMLIIEDGSSSSNADPSRIRIPLLIGGQGGDFLLNENACDLRKDEEKLASVTQKLFLLWGNLQEQKEEAAAAGGSAPSIATLSSRPFECLVHEYGIPSHSLEINEHEAITYKRLFQIFGTTIMLHPISADPQPSLPD